MQRNSNRDNQYVFTIAQRKCESRKHSTLGNHRKDETLWWRVEQMIKDEDWSPRQISGVLSKEGIHICAQTIYNHVHADTKGELAKHMPHELRYRRKEKKQYVTKATNIPNRTSIHDRPKEADGKRFGDWEMDLIVDSQQHVILTLVERSTNMLLMQRIPTGKKSEPIAKAVVKQLFPYRRTVKTITTKRYDSSKSYPLVVFCHGFLGNWQLYSGIWRDLDNCIVLSIGTDNLSGIFRDKDIKGIFTKQIPFLESLGYKIDSSQMHLIGLSNGYSACCVAYNGYGNKFRSITAISTGSFYTGAGKRTCQINLLGGDDCCGFPVTAKRYQELGMDAACYCEPTDNHFFAVNHRKQMINFLNERLNCTVK